MILGDRENSASSPATKNQKHPFEVPKRICGHLMIPKITNRSSCIVPKAYGRLLNVPKRIMFGK